MEKEINKPRRHGEHGGLVEKEKKTQREHRGAQRIME
jgi:hypothetical protein